MMVVVMGICLRITFIFNKTIYIDMPAPLISCYYNSLSYVLCSDHLIQEDPPSSSLRPIVPTCSRPREESKFVIQRLF